MLALLRTKTQCSVSNLCSSINTKQRTETIQGSTQAKHFQICSNHNLWQTKAQETMHLKKTDKK